MSLKLASRDADRLMDDRGGDDRPSLLAQRDAAGSGVGLTANFPGFLPGENLLNPRRVYHESCINHLHFLPHRILANGIGRL